MKNTIDMRALVVFSILLLTSCSYILFVHPQPVGLAGMDHMPADLIGVYLDESDDTLNIDALGVIYDEMRLFTLDEPQHILTEVDGSYVFSFPEFMSEDAKSVKGWFIHVVTPVADGCVIKALAAQTREDAVALVEELQTWIRVAEIEDEEGDKWYLIDPSADDFRKLLAQEAYWSTSLCRRLPF